MAKRIPYKITDIAALQAAYPEVVTDRHVVEKVVDKEKLYQVIKLNHSLERKIDGVEIDAPPQSSSTSSEEAE